MYFKDQPIIPETISSLAALLVISSAAFGLDLTCTQSTFIITPEPDRSQ